MPAWLFRNAAQVRKLLPTQYADQQKTPVIVSLTTGEHFIDFEFAKQGTRLVKDLATPTESVFRILRQTHDLGMPE